MSSPAVPPSRGSDPSGAPQPWVTTDPGLDAVESLYRGATGRSGLRAFEPALRPPEGTRDHSWLFRPDEPAASARPVETGESASTGTGPAAVRWSSGPGPTTRRWPAAALVALGVACALLLPWVLRAA